MSATCCPFIKPDGAPCAARPLPNSSFCLFHDPAHQQALAESRSKGGSTPRRRLRRFPRLLDHVHVAELLGELFIDSLNNPDAIDTKRLQALTALSRALLKAVVHDPALLIWLDAPANRKGKPNENLGRELMELFTLGIGHYTETDVKEAARALTGWKIARGEFRDWLPDHDDGEKTLLERRDTGKATTWCACSWSILRRPNGSPGVSANGSWAKMP